MTSRDRNDPDLTLYEGPPDLSLREKEREGKQDDEGDDDA